jgi:hypothetical protein
MKASGAALARRFSIPALSFILNHETAPLHKSFCAPALDEPAGLHRAARLGAASIRLRDAGTQKGLLIALLCPFRPSNALPDFPFANGGSVVFEFSPFSSLSSPYSAYWRPDFPFANGSCWADSE